MGGCGFGIAASCLVLQSGSSRNLTQTTYDSMLVFEQVYASELCEV